MRNIISKIESKKQLPLFLMIIAGFALIIADQTINKISYSNSPISRSGFYFDTYINISITDCIENYNDSIRSVSDIEAVLNHCIDLCEKYDNILNRHNPKSELYKLNHNSDFLNGLFVVLSDELHSAISKTIVYSSPFGESFTLLSGGLCDLWDYSKKEIPPINSIKEMTDYVNTHRLTLGESSVKLCKTKNSSFDYDDAYINLGASAKGYIADILKSYLISAGIRQAIIDLGGNVVVIGDKYDHSSYSIGIRTPFSDNNDILAILKCTDTSVVTSGIYERYFEHNGTIYHHIIDASTGYPAVTDILSITIICEDAVAADCYSTGCLMLSSEQALDFINSIDAHCIIIDKNYNILLSDDLLWDNSYIRIKNK